MSVLPPDHQIDAARLPVMLSTLRLPTIGRHWEGFASRADLEGWGAAAILRRCASMSLPIAPPGALHVISPRPGCLGARPSPPSSSPPSRPFAKPI